jgi:hypothetical protein
MKTFATPTRKGAGAGRPPVRRAARLPSPASSSRRAEIRHILHGPAESPVRRKIRVEPGVSIDSYLSGFVVSPAKSGDIYSHSGASYASISAQIVGDLLSSPRVFEVPGQDGLTAATSLGDHVQSRKGIVEFAAKKKYTFAAGSAMTMNPKYWRKVGAGWRVKPGVDPKTAMEDVNITPKKYKIACQAATQLTMMAGSGFSPLTKDTGVGKDDWVPGDWGYIKNTQFVPGSTAVGLEGENLIYTGGQQFWGHFSGTNTYRTLDQWIAEVMSWNTPGGAALRDYRKRPSRGLA